MTTTYGYNTARQLVEVIREEIKDGDVVVTPETITTYTYDAAGRTLTTRRVGAMETTESAEFDSLGRVTKQTDVLGRVTTTAYSENDLTATVTSPAGATTITIRNADGSTASVSGTAQRALVYVYDLNGNNERFTTKLADGTTIEQSITNGFGQTTMQAQASTAGFIYTRSEYNAKGQLVKQYQDTGWNTAKTAPTLFEYDVFGNICKQTLALTDTPTKDNSPMIEMAYSLEAAEDGVFSVTTQTHYNATGEPLRTIQKHLISQLSAILASKSISIDIRNNSSTDWSEFTAPSKVTSYSTILTSSITAESVEMDGFTISQKDHAGTITTVTRSYTDTGSTMINVDGRGNASTTLSDLAGRTISITDAAGATTTTLYDAFHDLPAVVTDAMGNTACYKYDARGLKIAEWGTAIQPACFGYDDMDNMTSLRTFRAASEEITTDPSNRDDYDETVWNFHPATGLEISRTYADGSTTVKTYDAYNRLVTEKDARGIIKIHSYEQARGLLLGTSYSDSTNAIQFTYNHLGQLTQVVDDASTYMIGYNSYGEQEKETMIISDVPFSIDESFDSYGRSIGYSLSRGESSPEHVVTYGYDSIGNVSTVAFMMGSAFKSFSYNRHVSSNLLNSIIAPNGISRQYTYDEHRDLITSINDKRGATQVVNRNYVYDKLWRPITCTYARQGTVRNDTFTHNKRSELSLARVNGKEYDYSYDNIGNRQQSTEDNTITAYSSNALNQYIGLCENEENNFIPEFDSDGNQTLIKTSTGVWSVVYNALNQPLEFVRTNDDGSLTVISAEYDYMGRRVLKKEEKVIPATDYKEEQREVISYHRYIYRDYLQIAALDLTRETLNALWYITWDPTEPIATRPLAIQKDGTWYTYGIDITKNITEIYGADGYIKTVYTYSPFGTKFSSGNIIQPIQWSSEFYDETLALVYYNYRYYNPMYSSWITRDPEETIYAKYNYLYNMFFMNDYLGLIPQGPRPIWHHVFPRQHIAYMKRLLEQCGKTYDFDNEENGVYLCDDVHQKLHNQDKWNDSWKKLLDEAKTKCCDELVTWLTNKIAEKRAKLIATKGGVPVDARFTKHYHAADRIANNKLKDPCNPDNQPNAAPATAPQKITTEETEKTHEEGYLPSGAVISTPRVTKSAAKKAVAYVAKKAIKCGIKKIPIVGWGYAAYCAYRGYRTGGLVGALIGAFF